MSRKKKDIEEATTLAPPVSANAPEAALPASKEEIEKFLKKEFNKLQTVKKKSEEDKYIPLQAMLSEYLQNYIILGYTPDGERLAIWAAKSACEYDALMEHLKNFFLKNVVNK